VAVRRKRRSWNRGINRLCFQRKRRPALGANAVLSSALAGLASIPLSVQRAVC